MKKLSILSIIAAGVSFITCAQAGGFDENDLDVLNKAYKNGGLQSFDQAYQNIQLPKLQPFTPETVIAFNANFKADGLYALTLEQVVKAQTAVPAQEMPLEDKLVRELKVAADDTKDALAVAYDDTAKVLKTAFNDTKDALETAYDKTEKVVNVAVEDTKEFLKEAETASKPILATVLGGENSRKKASHEMRKALKFGKKKKKK